MSDALLELKDVCKVFKGKNKSQVVAAHHLNLKLMPGESIAVVGESGCGKSTLAKMITMVERPDSGQILFERTDLSGLSGRALRLQRQKMQMVFQQPMSAISPRMTIGRFLRVPLQNFHIVEKEAVEEEVDRLLEMVHLPASYKTKLPHEVSGGELQRVMIARAMAGRPTLLICDEATSALDVAVQEEIIALIQSLLKKTGVSCIFITHDLSLVRQVSQRVVVMYHGHIVEILGSGNIVSESRHPYTKFLISSVFTVNCDKNAVPPVLEDTEEPDRPEDACPFFGRCLSARTDCRSSAVHLYATEEDRDHLAACPYVLKKAHA